MQILFIASRFPYPITQGDRSRAYHQLRLLSCQHRITLVTPEPNVNVEASTKAVEPLCVRIVTPHRSRLRQLGRLAGAVLSGQPFQTAYYFPPTVHAIVRSLLCTGSYDLIHVQTARMAPVADASYRVPMVVDLIDALSLNWSRRADRERIFPVALGARLEAGRLARYERQIVAQYDHVLVSSPVDKQAVGSADKVHVIPNGVDLEQFPYRTDGREADTIVFTGRMAYFPNADAAVWFATEILPMIRAQVPQARFQIVGADPPRRVKQLHNIPGVVVAGYVPCMSDYLARAAVAVAPMRAGSGMQIKILEAMACGTPMVVTPYASAGVEAEHKVHFLVAGDAAQFAKEVVSLLRDPLKGREMARRARYLVEEKYTWERSVTMLEAVYEQATCREQPTGPSS